MRELLRCLVQMRWAIIALLRMSKSTTVVLPVVNKQMLSDRSIAGGCNMFYLVTYEKLSLYFKISPFFVLQLLLSSKGRWSLVIVSIRCFLFQSSSMCFSLCTPWVIDKMAGHKGDGKNQIERPCGVWRSSFIPHFKNPLTGTARASFWDIAGQRDDVVQMNSDRASA